MRVEVVWRSWLASSLLIGSGDAIPDGKPQKVLQAGASASTCLPGFSASVDIPTRRDRFGFNLDNKKLAVHEQIDVEAFRVRGVVFLTKGEADQAHDVEVFVKSQAAESNYFDCLDYSKASNENKLTLQAKDGCDLPQVLEKPFLCVDVVFAVRPHIIQFGLGGTVINTTSLPITIWPGLSFETFVTTLKSVYGSISCNELNSFTAHSISVASEYGPISGNWSLPGDISFTTTKHSDIHVDLIPKRWSYGPSTTGNLVARAENGAIEIRMPFEEDRLSLRNATANITTENGAIRASLVHGASTYVRTSNGLIDLTLLPYWAFAEWQGIQHNFITTECLNCKTNVRVLESVVVPYFKTKPMYFAKSSHKAKNGALRLKYPKDWAGVAGWKVERGFGRVRGDDYEIIEDGWRHGKIQRRPLGSELTAELENGFVDLKMEG